MILVSNIFFLVSEPYLQFKDSLLKEYILPLIQSDNEYAIGYALDALSNFPAQDIATILPEKAMDYILQCTNGKPNKNQHKVLVTLMSNELDHMRRGLFKGEAKQQKAVIEDPAHKIQATNEGGEIVGERELAMASSFINSWDDTRVAPGLRSGYASAILHIIDQANSPDNVKGATMEDISKTKWYRCMVTSFTDVSLTDHLMIRVSSIQSWKTFFKNALSRTENDMEAIVSFVLKDLLLRLERSTVPGVTCNITLALTGKFFFVFHILSTSLIISLRSCKYCTYVYSFVCCFLRYGNYRSTHEKLYRIVGFTSFSFCSFNE